MKSFKPTVGDMYYACIKDRGSKNGMGSRWDLNRPMTHLIKMDKRMNNNDFGEMIEQMFCDRVSPKVIGAWSDDENSGLDKFIEIKNP
jgi:hypothetical protein